MKKIILLTISFVMMFSMVTPSMSAQDVDVPILGLLGYWKFDENSWAGDCFTTDISDSSGSNHHGTACIDGDAPVPVPGKFGNSGRFDGLYQYANMGPGFNFTASFTASVWIALDDYTSCGPTGKSQHIIGTHHLATPTGNGRGWGIYWDCDGLAWELTNSTGSAIGSYGFIQPTPFPVDGSWHHAALVYDSTIPSASLYWDGALAYSESGITNVPGFLFNNGEPLTVNGLPYAPSSGAPGKIDETRVYNRALSPVEIQSLFGNQPPTGMADSSSTNEDTPLVVTAPGVLGNDSDPDGDTLTAILEGAPTHGTLSLNPNGSYTYTPEDNYFGNDSFTYKANDGVLNSELVTVTILISAVNDPPVGIDDTGYVLQGGVLNEPAPGVLANDSDPEEDLLMTNITPVTLPAHGSLTLNTDGSYIYIHDGGDSTSDSFVYETFDGNGGMDTATVHLTIMVVNHPPVAVDDNATTRLDTAVIIDVLANDTDLNGDSLVVESVTQGSNGTVTNDGNEVIYTPEAGYYGTDIFSYTISDGKGGTDTAIVSVKVNWVSYLPVVMH